MTNYPHILFNKSPEQLRRLGARGGKAYGRNRRARHTLMPKPAQPTPPRAGPRETTAQAINLLDAQFLWLRGAEKRVSPNPATNTLALPPGAVQYVNRDRLPTFGTRASAGGAVVPVD